MSDIKLRLKFVELYRKMNETYEYHMQNGTYFT